MKKYIFVLSVIILITAVAFTTLSNGKTKTVKESRILSVNDIASDPSAYKGVITITGVVAQVARQGEKIFLLVDTTEAKHCKSTGCARFYLPVRHESTLPKEWDEVNVTGSFVDGGRVFSATKVEVLRHLDFGGK